MSFKSSNVENAPKSLIHENAQSPSCTKNVIITAVALLAIGALIVGTLTLLMNLNISIAGLSALSQIPLPASIGLMAVGAAGIIALIVRKKCSQTTPLKKDESFSEKVNKPESFILDITSESSKSDPRVVGLTESAAYLGITGVAGLLLDLNIGDVKAHVEGIYGNNIPQLRLNTADFAKVPGNFINNLKLLLLKNEELLNLSLDDLNKLLNDDKETISILHYRLSLIEEKLSASPTKYSENSLGAFRQLNFVKFTKEKTLLNWPGDLFFSFLTTKQIVDYFEATDIIPPNLASYLLPFNGNLYTNYYSSLKLQALSFSTIQKHITSFEANHIRLLSNEQLQSTSFPWKAAIEKHRPVLFSLGLNDILRTKEILQLLSIKSIEFLINERCLKGEHLQLLSNEQLQSTQFPWQTVSKDWFYVRNIFLLELDCVKRTQEILQLLKIDVIKMLLEKNQITGHHLRLLSDEQIQSRKFPWPLIINNNCVNDLFSTKSEDIENTKRLLALLNINTLQILNKSKLPDNIWNLIPEDKRNKLARE